MRRVRLMMPKTQKTTNVIQNQDLYIATTCIQGWRASMEDRHKVLLDQVIDDSVFDRNKKWTYVGIFDGHSGTEVAQHVSENLHNFIFQEENFKTGFVWRGVKEAFIKLDDNMMKYPVLGVTKAGCTAVVIMIRGPQLYCINAGDSRAVACVDDIAVDLSTDHKPYNPVEQSRIEAAGYKVRRNRVAGQLSVSRGFGDFRFKKNPTIPPSHQAVTCIPETRLEWITSRWKFILLACDGIWSIMSSRNAVDFVMERILEGQRPEYIIEELVDTCVYPSDEHLTSHDNISIIMIVIKSNMTDNYKELLKVPPPLKVRENIESPEPSTSRQHKVELSKYTK